MPQPPCGTAIPPQEVGAGQTWNPLPLSGRAEADWGELAVSQRQFAGLRQESGAWAIMGRDEAVPNFSRAGRKRPLHRSM